MQNIIHRVMEAESEAKRILEEAQTEAERLIKEARQQAGARDEQVRGEVRQSTEALITDAEKSAQKENSATLTAAVGELESSLNIEDSLRNQVVNAVVECVSGRNQTG